MKKLLKDSLIKDLSRNYRTNFSINNKSNRITISDIKSQGLSVDIRKNGISFYFRITLNGRTNRITIGSFPAINVANARRICEAHRTRLMLQSNEHPVQKDVKMRLDEYYEQHFLPWCEVYQKTYSSHRSLYMNHLVSRFGKMYLDEISNKYLYGLVQDLIKKEYSKSFVNKSIQHFRSALKKADQLCDVQIHPSLSNKFSLPMAPPKKERFLNDKEAHRLRDYIASNDKDEVILLIGFLLYTGARRHEAFNAEWQHIKIEERSWYVPITKSGKPRYIVLNQRALEIAAKAQQLQYEKYGEKRQWLFANPTTQKPYRCIFHKWNRIRNELNLSDVRIHDLRHSFASTLVNNGATLYEVQKLLGHSRSTTTERYAHLANHRLAKAASLIDKAYE